MKDLRVRARACLCVRMCSVICLDATTKIYNKIPFVAAAVTAAVGLVAADCEYLITQPEKQQPKTCVKFDTFETETFNNFTITI